MAVTYTARGFQESQLPYTPLGVLRRRHVRCALVRVKRPPVAAGIVRITSHRNSLRLDLGETNRKQLLIAGILPEHLEVARICTSCYVEHFFSHRGEHGKTGRFPVVIALQ